MIALVFPLAVYFIVFLVSGLLINYSNNHKIEYLVLNTHLLTLALNVLITSALLLLSIYNLELRIIDTTMKPIGKVTVLAVLGILIFSVLQPFNVHLLLKENQELYFLYIIIILLISFSSWILSTAISERKRIHHASQSELKNNQ